VVTICVTELNTTSHCTLCMFVFRVMTAINIDYCPKLDRPGFLIMETICVLCEVRNDFFTIRVNLTIKELKGLSNHRYLGNEYIWYC
jgi:hypothetical protein